MNSMSHEENKGRILYNEEQIAQAIRFLADRINYKFKNIDSKDIVVLSVLTGAFKFTMELIKSLDFDFQLEWIKCSSYINNQQGDVSVNLIDIEPGDLDGKYVVLVDDILDTGKTIGKIVENLRKNHSIEYIHKVFMVKRKSNKDRSDFDFCFNVDDDGYLVGFGLDDNGYKRNLPYIGVKDALY